MLWSVWCFYLFECVSRGSNRAAFQRILRLRYTNTERTRRWQTKHIEAWRWRKPLMITSCRMEFHFNTSLMLLSFFFCWMTRSDRQLTRTTNMTKDLITDVKAFIWRCHAVNIFFMPSHWNFYRSSGQNRQTATGIHYEKITVNLSFV